MTESEALGRGKDFGIGLLPLIKSLEAFETDEERLLFWTGFFGALYGIAAASIGPGALEAIRATIIPLTETVLNEHRH